MNTKLALVALFSIASLYAMDGELKNACTDLVPSTHVIEPFNIQRDSAEFVALFLAERAVLVQRPHFDLNKMLLRDSVYYDDESTWGTLTIDVLRDLNEQSQMTLCAFAAYTVSKDRKSFQGELLAVKRNARDKDYAQYLLRHGIDKAREEGATDIWSSTLKTNVPAQMLYKKVAKEYSQYELVEEPFNEKLKKLGKPVNDRAEQALAFTLKLKQQPPQ